MKKTHKLLILSVLALLCLSVFVGCSGFGAKQDIEWQIIFDKEECQHASISVEGYDGVPTKIASGEKITVTIDGINGYRVHTVKVNNRKILPDENGKYVFTVTEKTEVKITLREKVASVNLPEMEFYAGETLDRKTVEAEIVYATGRTEKTNKYSVIYQSESADSFSMGDTYYSVKVSADREKLYRVDLKQPVVAKGVIDPHGGVIADEYFEALKSNTEISDLKRDENGAISFIYTKPLSADILLPTADQISKGEGDDFVFMNWSGAFKEGTDKSVKATAVYNSKLVVLDSVKFETRIVDGEEVPYLVFTGRFYGVTNAYLYLAEANQGIEINGMSIGDENTQRGDSFELLLDLREITDKKNLGAWLDLKFRSNVDGYIETQEFNVDDYDDSLVDLTSTLIFDGYKYEFQTYMGYLKLETNEHFYHGYNMSYSVNDNGEVILTINGNVVRKYSGNFVKIDVEYDSNDGNKTVETQYCEIDDNGDYSVSINLFSIPLNHNAYIHFWIIDSIEEENVIFVGYENNLQNDWCENTDLSSKYNSVGLITDGGLRCPNPDETKTYFVGKGKWGGIVIYGKSDTDFSYSTDSAEIYTENDRVLVAVTGSYSGKKEEMENEIAAWVCDLQENPYASGKTDWPGNWTAHYHDMVVTVGDDGSFKIVIDVTDIQWTNTDLAKWCYTFHIGVEGQGVNGQNPDLKLTGELGNKTVSLNGKTYTLTSVRGSSDGAEFWGCLGLTITQ